MAADKGNQYFRVKTSDGEDILCPVRNEVEPEKADEKLSDDCFERDVVERYAGNIEIIET